MTTAVQEKNEQAVARQDRPVWRPRVNITETQDAYHLEAEMPGVPQDGIELVYEKNELRLRGRAEDSVHEDYKHRRIEYRTGDYERAFRLPEGVDPDAIKAVMKHGVLYVTLPKRETEKPKTIKVKGE